MYLNERSKMFLTLMNRPDSSKGVKFKEVEMINMIMSQEGGKNRSWCWIHFKNDFNTAMCVFPVQEQRLNCTTFHGNFILDCLSASSVFDLAITEDVKNLSVHLAVAFNSECTCLLCLYLSSRKWVFFVTPLLYKRQSAKFFPNYDDFIWLSQTI